MSKYKGKHGGKKGQKIRAWVDPPPLIWAMPERKRFFSIDVFPNSHIVQTSVMHHVQSTPEHYWNSGNLEKCFVDTLRLLLHGLQEKMICDIFFPEVIFDKILSFGMESDRTSLLLECNLEASGESLGSDQVEPGEKGDRRLVGPSPQEIRQNWQSHADFLLKMLFLF